MNSITDAHTRTASASPSTVDAATPSPRVRILLVEDDSDDYVITRELLNEIKTGRFDLEWVDSYDAASDRIRRDAFDLFLLDYRLGERTGIDLLHEIGELGIDAPVIMLTGIRSREADLAVMQAGAADYLLKYRLEPDALERSIRYALDRRHSLRALRMGEHRYRALVEQVPAVMYRTTLGDAPESLYISPQIEALLGYDSAEWSSIAFQLGIVHDDDRASYVDLRSITAASHAMFDLEYRYVAKSGTSVWVRNVAHVVHDDAGVPLFWQGFITDISRQVAAQLALRQSESRFRSVVQHASDMVTIIDVNGTMVYQSPSVERVLGFTSGDLVGSTSIAFPHPADASAINEAFATLRTMPEQSIQLEGRFAHLDGSWRTLEIIAMNLLHDPDIAGIVVNARDITERKALEAELVRQAFHDDLTGLPNRALFLDRMTQASARSDRSGVAMAVLFLDLDNFKRINDSLGHQAGDALLVEVAKRLQTCVRASDTVARLSGDEFTVLLENVDDVLAVAAVTRKILTAIRAPFTIEDRNVFSSASIGLTLRHPGQGTSDDAMRDADVAMYRSKARGKDRFEIFDQSMHARALEQLELELELRQAIERDELVLHYQPITVLASGELAGFEALIRWQHPVRGLVPPLQFIPLAEETGLIVTIGAWALDTACRQAAIWNRERLNIAAPLSISVNLSARQFQDPALVERVSTALAASDLDPACLTLEITESAVMVDPESVVVVLHSIAALGVQIAIDDFGTGYSSMAYLTRFPVQQLKIDRSFVSGLGSEPDDTAIVAATVGLAHALGIQLVGEGVETGQQAAALRALGCQLAQGYLFSKPVPTQDVDYLICEYATQVSPDVHPEMSASHMTSTLPASDQSADVGDAQDMPTIPEGMFLPGALAERR